MHILIGLALAAALLFLAFWLATLVIGLGWKIARSIFIRLAVPATKPPFPWWLSVGIITVLSGVVCLVWSPGWGMVAAFGGAVVLHGKAA
jgi:hypothetical protein